MTMAPKTAIKTEADLCAAFIAEISKPPKRSYIPQWTVYPETAGFDILLVRKGDGVQIGIEAKLVLNSRVVAQALPDLSRTRGHTGPEYRAVLVPSLRIQADMEQICKALGVTVLRFSETPVGPYSRKAVVYPELPMERQFGTEEWHEWAPQHRCPLPDYVPDVGAGHPSPLTLTLWKVKALKLCVLLETRPVNRADFKHLELSPTNWTGPRGWLVPVQRGYIASPRMPNFRRQHPRVYEEIKADFARWAPKHPSSWLKLRRPAALRY